MGTAMFSDLLTSAVGAGAVEQGRSIRFRLARINLAISRRPSVDLHTR